MMTAKVIDLETDSSSSSYTSSYAGWYIIGESVGCSVKYYVMDWPGFSCTELASFFSLLFTSWLLSEKIWLAFVAFTPAWW